MGQIGNKTRPRALVQNQHVRELISARNKQHKHNDKDLILTWHACKYKVHKLHQRYMGGCTSDGVYVYCIYTHAR